MFDPQRNHDQNSRCSWFSIQLKGQSKRCRPSLRCLKSSHSNCRKHPAAPHLTSSLPFELLLHPILTYPPTQLTTKCPCRPIFNEQMVHRTHPNHILEICSDTSIKTTERKSLVSRLSCTFYFFTG